MLAVKNMKKIKLSIDNKISLFVFIVAFCALFVSIWQGYITREHNIISVKPNLTFYCELKQNYEYNGISIKNSGIGPAIIKKWNVSIDKNPIMGNGAKIWDKINRKENFVDFDIRAFWFDQNHIISPEERVNFFYLPANINKNSSLNKLQSLVNRIEIEIEYSSIYEEEIFIEKYTGCY